MNALPEPVLNRLIKLSGMMTSTFEAERATAASLASALLRQHGLTWADVLRARAGPAPSPPPRPSSAARDWRAAVRDCLMRPAALTAWEAAYLADLRHWSSPLSPKQAAKLRAICARLNVPPPP